jgi:adenosylcobinamide kinase / adenosylcobinamide-phosphate guanylyltransferase
MRTLITGGVKSGKSRRALELAQVFPGPRCFVATAEAFDDEMRERIARHRAERGDRFVTIEEPIRIDRVVRDNCVLDCVPLWLNNIFYQNREAEIDPILDALLERLPVNIVIVTNEIGMGIIPSDAITRRYENTLGRVNARLASALDSVELMVAGIPVKVK